MQFLAQFIELYHINRMQFLGQTFSLIGAFFISYSADCINLSKIFSVFGKNKKNIVILQLCTNIFCTLTNIFLRSYSGVVANAILSIRHFLDIKGKMTALTTVIISILITVLGLYFNTRGLVGLCPIMASVLFVIFTYIAKSAQHMRLNIGFTILIWSFHDFTIKSYPLFIMDFTIAILSFIKYTQVAIKDKQNSGREDW